MAERKIPVKAEKDLARIGAVTVDWVKMHYRKGMTKKELETTLRSALTVESKAAPASVHEVVDMLWDYLSKYGE